MNPTNRRLWLATALALVCGGLTAVASYGEPNYDEGVRRYKKGDYRGACAYFEQSMKQDATESNANAFYFAGLCWQQLKDMRMAASRYNYVMQNFPEALASDKARAALQQMTQPPRKNVAVSRPASSAPTAMKSGEDSTTAAESEAGLVLNGPDTTKVYYRNSENAAGVDCIIPVSVNNRQIDMCFDTGASSVYMGKNHLAEIGVAPPGPGEKPTGSSIGVGSSAPTPTWTIKANLKLGEITIPNCPITICEHCPTQPLLGQTVLKQLAYTIDYGSKSITFHKRSQARAEQTRYDVPFERRGGDIIVDVEINGKPFKMYFDTGAMGCSFAPQHLKALKVELPEDAREGVSTGIGGNTRTWYFPLRRIKCGPIEKNDFEVSVVEQSGMEHPLLGQTFFAGWQYTIDNQKDMIHFVRR